MKKLSELLNDKEIGILQAPGCFDAISAKLIQQSGFKVAFLSGASIAYSQISKPDIGLTTMTEVAEVLSHITENTDIPIIVDADTGFGNSLNLERTVKLFEKYGAQGIQIEDQTFPKRCGQLKGKTVISKEEMVGKLKCAVDNRKSKDTLIIARTDSVAVEGIESAIERCNAYIKTGVDILFVEALRTEEELKIISDIFSKKIKLLVNLSDSGVTPNHEVGYYEKLGYSIAYHPGMVFQVYTKFVQKYLKKLLNEKTTKNFIHEINTVSDTNKILETQKIMSNNLKYQPCQDELTTGNIFVK